MTTLLARYSQPILLILAAVIGASAQGDVKTAWDAYKSKYDTTGFRSLGEEDTRFRLFSQTFTNVEEHNRKFAKKEVKSKLGIYEFAAWTPQEKGRLFGATPPPPGDKVASRPSVGLTGFRTLDAGLPDSLDWRESGYVSSVKQQAGLLEGQLFQRQSKNDLVFHAVTSLSPQQLADCAEVSKCCGEDCGQNPASVMEQYVTKNALVKDKDYPYVGTRNDCGLPPDARGLVKISTVSYVEPRTDEAVMEAVARIGPLSVLLNANDEFSNHKEGIADIRCEPGVNHAVLLVGYGKDDDGRKYWIIKNSWSEAWGEKGYIRMYMNDNSCGISSWASYAVLA